MTASKSNDKVQAVLESIVEAFKAGTLPDALAKIYLVKPLDTHCTRWSFRNQIITYLKGHLDARGFRQWQEIGRSVRKGERAFHILAPLSRRIHDPEHERADAEGFRTMVTGFKAIPVFGYNQTEGEPIETLEHREFLEALPFLEVARAWNLKVQVEALPRAYGQYRRRGEDKTIALAVENLSTFAHELVHAADDRLHQLQGAKPILEAVAQLGATALLKLIGEEEAADLGGTFQYIESYARQTEASVVDLCLEVLDRTAAAVDLIYTTSLSLQPKSSAA